MHRHFVTPAQLNEPVLTLPRDEARHLLDVLRVRVGEAVELCDGAGRRVSCRVSAMARHGLTLEHVAAPSSLPPLPCRLTLCACVCKRMDWTIEKAVELGAARIVPVLSERCVIRLDGEADRLDKRARWERVALDAARQCGAAWLPRIETPLPFAEVVALLAGCRPLLVAALTPDARPLRTALTDWRSRPAPAEAAWVTGPEGDFTPGELQELKAAGGELVSLGRQVLRAETAAIYGLCVLGAEWCYQV
ncbi:MAG: RsmE family RNA methyltransferase [Kiritimatiellae bacterium]|nr:RsmE family RNA methyltransferase [Kiritimatiellia bacterium]